MKKISISIIIIFIFSNIFLINNTYATSSLTDELVPISPVIEDIGLVSYDLKTQEKNIYHLPTSILENPDITPLQGYIPRDLASSVEIIENSASPDKVIDDDERVRVTDTSSLPYSCIGLIEVTFPDGFKGSGTAFLVAKNIAVTAGHCTYDKSHGGLAQAIKFTPGKKGTSDAPAVNPYGSVYCSRNILPIKYQEEQDLDYDWAILVTASNIGEKCGWMSIGTYPDPQSCVNLPSATISGYPGTDQPGTIYGFQYKATGRISKASEYRLEYQIDMTQGQSGSPIFNSDGMAFGVNASEYFVQAKNEGSRVTLFFLTSIRDTLLKYQ